MFILARVCRTTLGRGRPVRTASSSVQPSCPGRAPPSTTATTTHRPRGTSGRPPGACTQGTTRPRPAEGLGLAATTSLLPREAEGTTTSRYLRDIAGTTTPHGRLLVSSATARHPSHPGKGLFTPVENATKCEKGRSKNDKNQRKFLLSLMFSCHMNWS